MLCSCVHIMNSYTNRFQYYSKCFQSYWLFFPLKFHVIILEMINDSKFTWYVFMVWSKKTRRPTNSRGRSLMGAITFQYILIQQIFSIFLEQLHFFWLHILTAIKNYVWAICPSEKLLESPRHSNGKFQTCFNFTDNCRTIFIDTVYILMDN